MIENILTLITIALIIHTTDRRHYVGFLLLSYYAIFILIDIEFFGFQISSYIISSKAIQWETFCILISLLFTVGSAFLFFKGSNVCGVYGIWLIWNAIVIFIESLDENNAFIIELLYNCTQNINLFVDLSVVFLGTDNSFHNKDRAIGNIIASINNRIDGISLFKFNNRT